MVQNLKEEWNLVSGDPSQKRREPYVKWDKLKQEKNMEYYNKANDLYRCLKTAKLYQ
jgi:hypothetical protein